MSLISAVPGESTDEQPVSGRGSVYQVSGKPLSKEALYRAKLKYGVYQSPAKSQGPGVADSKLASDVAANLANSNRTTVEAYKRLLNPNASKAASAVAESVVNPSSSVGPASRSNLGLKHGRQSAAMAASAAPMTSRSRASSSASASGVSPVNAKIPKMDITKVLAGAERNAAERVYQRTNPDQVSYVKGISERSVGKAAGASFSLSSEIVNGMSTKSEYIKQAEKESHAAEWAQKAVEAMKDFNPNDLTDKNWRQKEEERNKLIKHLTSETVLSKARSNAQERLDSIDREQLYRVSYSNMDHNKAAVAIAQQNLKKSRASSSATASKVNLGGGLWLAAEDIDNIAKGLIAPVLDEVDQRTGAQRALDIDIKKRDLNHKQQYDEWVKLQTEKQNNDAVLQAKAVEKHKAESANTKATLAKKYTDLCTTKDAEVSALEKTLQAKKEAFEKLKQDLEEELKHEDERIAAECAELELFNSQDMEEAKKDQEEILGPFKADLLAAEKHQAELNEQRDEIQKSIDALRESIENHKSHVEKLQAEIQENEAKLQAETESVGGLTDEHQQLRDDIENNYVVIAEKAKEDAKISSEEARLKQLEVDAMINERQTELSNTEIQLKKEKLLLINSLRDVAELKGEDKLDEAKVKAFVGTTSDEFIAQHKKAESEPEIKKAATNENVKIEAVAGTIPIAKAKSTASSHKKDSVVEAVSAVKSKKQEGKANKGSSIKKFFGLKDGTGSATENVNPEGRASAVPQAKAASTAKKSTTSTEPEQNDHNGTVLEPTFSGFSQGSIPQQSTKLTEIEPEDDDDDVVQTDSVKDKRKSLFKEVF